MGTLFMGTLWCRPSQPLSPLFRFSEPNAGEFVGLAQLDPRGIAEYVLLWTLIMGIVLGLFALKILGEIVAN